MSSSSPTSMHDIDRHPDVPEMRERYERLLRGREDSALDGAVLLAGLYAAVSPWIVHFSGSNPELRMNNLIIGLAVAAFGLGLTLAPERMSRLGWACAAAGVWLVIAPWVATVGHHPTTGMIWNNVVVGAVIVLLGCAVGAIRMATGRAARRTSTMSSAHPST
ncbi:SPW repeat protein [Streptacidiphilus sp. PB12-B1b]|nr:SPW repeat protein [Streptacidiphilus sp. PB12-B1b]QMU80154.1 SPW repeat protein [Streptacidiphilus sp. PB12-B1b]